MKIKIHRTIDIPDGFFCNGKHSCLGLTIANDYGTARVCSHFNCAVFPSPGIGRLVKCGECIDSTVKFLESSESAI